MTTTSSTPKSYDPDEECSICGVTRENHGDLNHEFNTEGLLIPKKKPEPARNTPPAMRGETVKELSTDMTAQAFLRLTDRLVAKGILDSQDLMYVLGNFDATNRG